MSTRVGFGYDIHRLVPGRPLCLGGVRVPFEKGLLGHSDGDAACHALADAILGAAALGDLGDHFPSGDPAWENASGVRLLEETRKIGAAHNVALLQADVTILAEAPRLAGFRSDMAAAMAAALKIDASLVSVKARTHDGIGPVGAGEAIAAYAVVLVEMGGM